MDTDRAIKDDYDMSIEDKNNQYHMDQFVEENVADCIGMFGPQLKQHLRQELR